MTTDFFETFRCPKGRLFDQYPNPLIYHWDEEEACDYVFLPALWTTHKSSFVEEEIFRKGLHLSGIEAYKHRRWRLWASKKREPDFTSLQSLQDVNISKYGVSGIQYTGRTHQISGKDFHEINLLRKATWNIKRSLPSLEELAEDVLREAENLIREKHGLPRIGEGWVSEMQLYNLVKEVFLDAQHHVVPAWLKPQELDVYVPSKKLAFEYQGMQHYEPVEFFGGAEALERRRRLDARKKRKCLLNGIVLIEWRFDEPIDRATFLQKLKAAKVKP